MFGFWNSSLPTGQYRYVVSFGFSFHDFGIALDDNMMYMAFIFRMNSDCERKDWKSAYTKMNDLSSSINKDVW